MHKSLIITGALILAGCAAGPDYQPPELPALTHFAEDPGVAAIDPAVEQHFWRGFDDPLLDSLIAQTLAHNQDLQAGLARYQQAQALLRGARLEQLPSARLNASASEQYLAELERPVNGRERVERYQTGLALSWELDLFGRLSRLTQAQAAALEASEADLGALQVALIGQLATSYFELRGLQLRHQVAQQNVELQRASLDLVSTWLEAGRGTLLDQVRAEAQLQARQALLPELEASIQVSLHRISVLTGQPPGNWPPALLASQPLPAMPMLISPGTPGELLRRRPDIRAAERRLASSNALIGVASADLFPRFSLDALLGSVAGSGADLFSAGSSSRSLMLGVDWSFLDRGRVNARVDAAQASSAEALAAYRQTLLLALEETETWLVRYHRGLDTDARLQQAVAAADIAVAQAQDRYRQGYINYFEVLTAEQELSDLRDRLEQSRTTTALAMVSLYRSLAGAPGPEAELLAARTNARSSGLK